MESENKHTDKNKKQRKKKRGIGKKILVTFLILLLLCIAAGTGIVFAVIKTAPALNYNVIGNLAESSKIYDDQGHFIENFSSTETRDIVPLSEISPYLQNAFIAIEDERFRQHHGIDVKRILSAIWTDIKTHSKAEGASTITQQLVKNYMLSSSKTYTRKLQEMYLAIQLERHLSKDQILEAYLNTISLGGSELGVQAASQYYFGVDASKIDPAEAAVIASITQNPTRYYPYSKANLSNPAPYLERQKLVLGKMLELHFITKDQYDAALKEDVVSKLKAQYTKHQTSSTYAKYQWFVEPAIQQVAQDFANKYGMTTDEAYQKLRTGGYDIYLTVNQNIQLAAENTVNNYKNYPMIYNKKDRVSPYDSSINEPQVAGVIMDVTNGEVKAVVGGRGPHPAMSANRATQIPRQPGSSIKPLSVYGPIIDSKIATEATVVDDAPLTQSFWKAGGWSSAPQNFDKSFDGYISLKYAVEDSKNIAAIKFGSMVGTDLIRNYLTNKFHITTLSPQDTGLGALALGGLTEGVTPLEMTAAYSAFANSGIYTAPRFYTQVKNSNGTVVLDNTPKQSRALSPQATYIMDDILQGVVQVGTGKYAQLGAMPAGGKTGTSDDHKNAWFAGFTPYYAGVFWMGSDNPNFAFTYRTSNTEIGGFSVEPIWKSIMLAADKGLPIKQFTKPSGIVSAKVCIDSGDVPTSLCYQDPRGSRVSSALFIDGTQPVKQCDIHVSAQIDTRNGLLAAPDTPPQYVQTKVFIKKDPSEPIRPSNRLYSNPPILPTQYSNIPNDVPTTPTTPPDNGTTPGSGDTGTGGTGSGTGNGNGNGTSGSDTTNTNPSP